MSTPSASPGSDPVPLDGAQALRADYAALAARVDAFFAGVVARHPSAMQCQAGCHGCCQDGLSVSEIEAAAIRAYLASLPSADRHRLQQQVQRHLAARGADPAGPESEPCALLDERGRCAIYPARPLVCRSQGLPLVYSASLIPAQALRFSARDGRAIVCCPLNFSDAAAGQSGGPQVVPQAADLLDAERLDLLLAVLNRRYVSQAAPDTPHAGRTLLTELVLAAADPAAEPTEKRRPRSRPGQ
jgi:hypothetical protein